MLRTALISLSILFSLAKAEAQLGRVVQFEGFIDGFDHRCFLFNTNYTCDSLNLKTVSGKKPDADALICYVNENQDGVNLTIYDKNGVSILVDSSGKLYSQDVMSQGAPYWLNIHLDDLLKGRKNMVLEVDDYDYDSLVIRATPLDKYKLGQENKKFATKVSVFYDDFTYPAKGEISPAVMNELYYGVQILPEDGKVTDKFTLILPVSKVPIPGTWSLYIYDLGGNILKMYTNLSSAEVTIHRENITTGTYKYAVYFNRTMEIKKGMIYFKEPPKPE
ncbi:MAG: hypothetical protein EP332_09455 [Bacteroidetes bacterium]|nr:MAG: hypothetical protein EP332_09455 [Bacteroidota bacterium]